MPVLLWAVTVASPARADLGFQAGPRVGLELDGAQELFLGGDARLSFSLSPMTVSFTFDYYFVEDQTLFQIGVAPLYYLPIRTKHLIPYAGAGVGVTRFEFHDPMPGTVSDDNGARVGLNLIGGVRFDLPFADPYAQVMITTGEIDLFTIGVGFLIGSGPLDRSRTAPAE